MNIYYETSDSYLSHHGVSGQKWGKRNGPPYPLDASDHSASERKAGWKKSLADNKKTNIPKDNAGNSGSKKIATRDDSVDKRRKALIIAGAAVTATALAGVGLYALHKSGKLDDFIKIGCKTVTNTLPNTDIVGGKLNFNKIVGTVSDNENLKKVNPLYNFPSMLGPTHMNCFNTTLAYELRNRGFDVQATLNNEGVSPESIGQFFSGIHSNSIKSYSFMSDKFENLENCLRDYLLKADATKLINRGTQVQEAISKNILKDFPDGARGNIYMPLYSGNHFISWSINDGKVTFANPQNPNVNIIRDIFGQYIKGSYGEKRYGVRVTRLDDLITNDSEIGLMVENAISNDEIPRYIAEYFKGAHRTNWDPFKIKGKNFIYNIS